MTTQPKPVLGVTAARARPTIAGATWLAAIISLPIGLVLMAAELVWRWLF